MDVSIKGQSCVVARDFIMDRFQTAGMDKLLADLDESARIFFANKIVPSSWCQEKYLINFIMAAQKVFIGDAKDIAFDIGFYSGEKSISSVYKIFMRLGDPKFIISRADRVWRQIHDHARLEIVNVEGNSAKVRLCDYSLKHNVFCRYLAGYFTAVLNFSGAKELKVEETSCACAGADYCEFTATWE